jgi:hypothetical protein
MIAATPQPGTERGALGQLMHDRRKHLGRSQKYSAMLAGISLQRWQQLELGYECAPDGSRKTPGTTPATLHGIAHALDMVDTEDDTREVFRAAGVEFTAIKTRTTTPVLKREERILQLLNGLAPEMQDGVEQLLRSMRIPRPYNDEDELPKAS